MRWQDSICVVPPPQIQTVKKTTSSVVENIICRAYVAVSLMDRAKVIAPRRPEGQNTQKVGAWKSFTLLRNLKLLVCY